MSNLEKKIKKIQSDYRRADMEAWLKTPEGESWLNCVLAEKAREQEILEYEAAVFKQEEEEKEELEIKNMLGISDREWRLMQEEAQEIADRREKGEEKEKLLDSLEEMEKLILGGEIVMEMKKEEKKEDPVFLRKKKKYKDTTLDQFFKKK